MPAGWKQETVKYPTGEMQTFSFEKQPLSVYDGDVVIVAPFRCRRARRWVTYPVKASLRYQACNDSQCLPPVTAEAEIQLKVGPGGQPQHADLFAKSASAGGEQRREDAGRGDRKRREARRGERSGRHAAFWRSSAGSS